MVSEVRYARSGDVHIAYGVAGEGPFDVVLVPGTTSHVELAPFRALFERIASFVRLIHFDKRGTGMSDASLSHHRTRPSRLALLASVHTAAEGSAAGITEAGSLPILMAATPATTHALSLFSVQ